MNVVTFETAKRLKEAGFPQPEFFVAAQRSYIDNGKGICYVCDDGEDVRENEYFAPSATDILKELGQFYQLYYSAETLNWYVWHETRKELIGNKFMHENPAEACAAAWLAKNEKL